MSYSYVLQKNHPDIDLRLFLQDGKESFLFNLYFHIGFNHTRLPALVNIKLIS